MDRGGIPTQTPIPFILILLPLPPMSISSKWCRKLNHPYLLISFSSTFSSSSWYTHSYLSSIVYTPRGMLILFHPPFSILNHIHPPFSILIYIHPPFSILIHIHPPFSVLIHIHPPSSILIHIYLHSSILLLLVYSFILILHLLYSIPLFRNIQISCSHCSVYVINFKRNFKWPSYKSNQIKSIYLVINYACENWQTVF